MNKIIQSFALWLLKITGYYNPAPIIITDKEYNEAVEIIKNTEKITISYLQRKLGISYNRTNFIIERMIKQNILSRDSTGKLKLVKRR